MRCLPTKQGQWYKCTRCGSTWTDSFGSIPLCSYREPTPYIKEEPLVFSPIIEKEKVEVIDGITKYKNAKLDKLTVV